jgi:hypothetical protein
LNASKSSRSSLQLRDALGFESFPSPAFLAQRLDVAHRQARTNAPLTNAFGGSARNSFVPLGNSLDTAGELAERRRRRVGTRADGGRDARSSSNPGVWVDTSFHAKGIAIRRRLRSSRPRALSVAWVHEWFRIASGGDPTDGGVERLAGFSRPLV